LPQSHILIYGLMLPKYQNYMLVVDSYYTIIIIYFFIINDLIIVIKIILTGKINRK
jgi:hypothetical protein